MSEGAQGAQCCNIEVDFTDLSVLCTMMPRRLLVTGLLIQWMRQHFTNPENIDNPFLEEVLWSENLEDTRISIDSVFKFNAAATEFRPGIFVAPGPWKIIRYGIDDRKMLGAKKAPCCDKTRVTCYNAMCQGSHTLFCVAGESAEVEILATEVYKELMMFGPIARKTFNFLRFVVSDIGEPSILEEATENFVVPVVISYASQDVWALCPPCVQDVELLTKNLWRMLE